ncbi:hypothetical protein FOS14_08145 [Skermania sp. ID1734]|uniref:hypothetical protein n=1 Tax=Skermania sp. ID1734 TaxID=2597516 RepID=UPI00117C1091|nr:hypothetical protein [Skermania sp. ID1734]TSE00384.1 hypothetical protein FOS14_08145 [Skermania sp. ID1734]
MNSEYSTAPVNRAGAIMRRPRLFRQLGSPARLTLVRGPRQSGKTALITSWLEKTGDRAIWLPRPPVNTTAEEYWRAALAQIDRDHQASTGQSPFSAVVDALGALDVPVVLVAEHLDAVDAVAADQVIELLQQCPLVFVVVEKRVPVFTRSQLLQVDYSEVDAEDLRFTRAETEELHRMFGVGISPAACGRLCRFVLGEVAPTMLAVQTAKRIGFPVIDELGIVRPEYSSQLVRLAEETLAGEDMAEWRDFVLTTAPALTVDADTARMLGIPDPEPALVALEALGVLERRRRDDALRYPAGLRFGLLALARRDANGSGTELLNELARRRLAAGDPSSAMRYAADAGNWQLVGEIIESNVVRVIEDDLDEAHRVLQSFPAAQRGRFPLVQVTRTLLTGLGEVSAPPVEFPESTDELIHIGRGPEAMKLATRGVAYSIALRRRGQYQEAAATARRLEVILDAMEAADGIGAERRIALFRQQLASTLLLAGDVDDAALLFQQAFQNGASHLRRVTAGSVALARALQGDMIRSRHWLESASQAPRPSGIWGMLFDCRSSAHR